VDREIVVILLAGGFIEINSQKILKCLIETPDKKSIIQHCLEIFRTINYSQYNLLLKKTLICVPQEFQEKLNINLSENEELVFSGNTLTETIENAIKHISNYSQDTYLVFVATDLPLINTEAINDIIMRFSLLQGDLFFPLVSKEVYKVNFGKESKRTFFKMKKDSFCSTGITIIKKGKLEEIFPKIKEIIENRKDPIKIINSLKLNNLTLLKLMLGMISVLEAEKIVEEVFNLKANALLTNYAILSFNIDKKEDLDYYYQNILKEKV